MVLPSLLLAGVARADGPGVPGEEAPVPGIDIPAPPACQEVEALLRETRRTGRSDDPARIDAAITPACLASVARGHWVSLLPLARERVLYDSHGFPTIHQRQTGGQIRALCRLRPPEGVADMREVIDTHPDGGVDADLCTAGLADMLDDAAFAAALGRWMGVQREFTDMGPWIVVGAERVARVVPGMSVGGRERFAPMLVAADERKAGGRDALRQALCLGPEERGPALRAACEAQPKNEEAVTTGRQERLERVVRAAARCLAALGWVFYALAAGEGTEVRGRFFGRFPRRVEIVGTSAFLVAFFPTFFFLLWYIGPPADMFLPISALFDLFLACLGAGAVALVASAVAVPFALSRTAVVAFATLAAVTILLTEWMPLPGIP